MDCEEECHTFPSWKGMDERSEVHFPLGLNPNSAVKVLKNRIVLIMRVNSDVGIVSIVYRNHWLRVVNRLRNCLLRNLGSSSLNNQSLLPKTELRGLWGISQIAFENPIDTQIQKVLIMSVMSDKSISREKYAQNRKVMIMREAPAFETFYNELIY